MPDETTGDVETEQPTPKLVVKTLTFGLRRVMGFDPKEGKLIPLDEDQGKAVYIDLINAARAYAQACNFQLMRTYAKCIMEVPEESANAFKIGNPKLREIAATLSGSVLSQVSNISVKALFSGEHRKALMTGKRNLPTFRVDGSTPIPNRAADSRLFHHDGAFYLASAIFEKDWGAKHDLPSGWIAFPIKAKSKRDKVLNGQLEKIVAGEWKLKNIRIKRDTRKKRWIGQAVVGYTPQPYKQLNPQIVMGIDLGVAVPACVHVRDRGEPQPWQQTVGDGWGMIKTRAAIKHEITRIVRGLRTKSSPIQGAARDAMIERLRTLRKREKRIMKTASQRIASQIAEIAKRNGAGTWQIEDLDLADMKEDQPWLTRNWAAGTLIDAIRWQAQQLGVQLAKVDPRKTSQRCSECGHIARENRSTQKDFKCVSCGYKNNADKNAARNLSILNIADLIKAALEA